MMPSRKLVHWYHGTLLLEHGQMPSHRNLRGGSPAMAARRSKCDGTPGHGAAFGVGSATMDKPAAMHVRQFTAVKLLALGAFGLLLYVAHQAFIPLALALLAALVLSGPVEMLLKFRIPRSLSASVILIVFLAATDGLVDLMWTPLQQWYSTAPATMKTIKR